MCLFWAIALPLGLPLCAASCSSRRRTLAASQYHLKHMDCNLQADYAPDGGYIPRIMFADNIGRLTPEVKNPSASPQCAPDFAFHSRMGGLIGAKGALALLKLCCMNCKLLSSSPLPKQADSLCVALCVQVRLLLPVVRRGENPS